MRFVSSDMSSTRGGQTSTQRTQPLQVSMSMVTVAGWRGIVPSRNTRVPEGQRSGSASHNGTTGSDSQRTVVRDRRLRCGSEPQPVAQSYMRKEPVDGEG